MTTKSMLQVFDQYQKCRLDFVKAIAELALKSNNIAILNANNVLEIVRPLLSDIDKQIRHCATVAVGRITQSSASMAAKFIQLQFLPIILYDTQSQNKHHKVATLVALRSICKHSPELAAQVIAAGAMEFIIKCLEDFEPMLQEAAAWAIGYIARHNGELARKCVDVGAVPLLVLCLQCPHLTLKQIATSAIGDIAKHNIDLAQEVVDVGAVPFLAKNLANLDDKLKRQIFIALSACAKHSTELAEVIVEAELFPNVFMHMAHPCPLVRRNAAILVRDVVKHSLELTQLIVNTGGIGALMQTITEDVDGGEARIPCITALGYISGQSAQFAMSVMGCNAVTILSGFLAGTKNTRNDENLAAVIIWTLGQIGKHSPEHSKAIAAANLFPVVVQLYIHPDSSEDLRFKCKHMLKLCLQKCLLVAALEPLLYDAPPNVLKYVLAQYSKILPHDPKARRMFVTTGSLQKMQNIDAAPGTTLMEYITLINACFPEEIVRYYSPGYPDSLLERVEQYTPQMLTVLQEPQTKDENTQMLLNPNTPSEELKNLLG